MSYNPPITGGGADLTVNRFSDIGGRTVNQQITSLYAVYNPNEYRQLLFRHKAETGLRMMLESMGNSNGTAAPTVGHYEAPWRQNQLTVQTVTGGATAGAAATVTLAASNMFNSQATVSGVARQASFPVVNDVYLFNNGVLGIVTAKNTTVTPHQLTIVPYLSTAVLATAITTGVAYSWQKTAFAEGTDLPPGRTPRFVKYENTFEIIKTAVSVTGSELTNEQYFRLIDEDSRLYALAKMDFYMDHELAFDNSLLFGQQVTNNITFLNPALGHDVSLSGTEGCIEFITNGGNTDTYTVGAYTIADFDDINRYYEQERVADSDLLACQGYELNLEIENALIALLDGDLAAMLEDRFGFNEGLPNDDTDRAGDKSMKFGFRGIKKGGYNYLFAKIAAFNSRMGAGSAAYDYNRWQLIFPKGKMVNVQNPAGGTMGIIGYEYKQVGNYSRKMQMGSFSGVGIQSANISNGTDIMITGMVSEIAFHGTRANACTIQRPA